MSDSSRLAATPPMGWNSWSMFGGNVSESIIRETADAMASLGLRDCGYEYIVIDDCWSVKDGRDSDGNLVPNPQLFPNGIKVLADYVHSKGLKFGIYSDAAELTCAGYPGSYGFEEQDVHLWASWGVDFLKYDYCQAPRDQATAIERYGRMGRALQQSAREMLYSICEWGGRNPHLWGKSVGGHMWRVTGDVADSWTNVWRENGQFYHEGVDLCISRSSELYEYGGPGGWNDLDLLGVGIKGKGRAGASGMTFDEYQTQMSVWCMACSPLMVACDVRQLDEDTASLLLNREVLAVNQDRLGIAARPVRVQNGCDIWRKPLVDGSVAVAVINRGSTASQVTLTAGDVGLLDVRKSVRDLWKQEDIAEFTGRITLERQHPHQTLLLRVGA